MREQRDNRTRHGIEVKKRAARSKRKIDDTARKRKIDVVVVDHSFSLLLFPLSPLRRHTSKYSTLTLPVLLSSQRPSGLRR